MMKEKILKIMIGMLKNACNSNSIHQIRYVERCNFSIFNFRCKVNLKEIIFITFSFLGFFWFSLRNRKKQD